MTPVLRSYELAKGPSGAPSFALFAKGGIQMPLTRDIAPEDSLG
jgi:hypothetical protein